MLSPASYLWRTLIVLLGYWVTLSPSVFEMYFPTPDWFPELVLGQVSLHKPCVGPQGQEDGDIIRILQVLPVVPPPWGHDLRVKSK